RSSLSGLSVNPFVDTGPRRPTIFVTVCADDLDALALRPFRDLPHLIPGRDAQWEREGNATEESEQPGPSRFSCYLAFVNSRPKGASSCLMTFSSPTATTVIREAGKYLRPA